MAAKQDFTDRFLKSKKLEDELAEPGKRRIVWDAQVPGFGIRLPDRDRFNEDYSGTFVLVTRFPGGSNPVPGAIGDYPTMSLAKAREIAREWREDIRKGIDPKAKAEARRRAEDRRRADTFAAVFEVVRAGALVDASDRRVVKRQIEVHVFPRWGQRPLSEIKRTDGKQLVPASSKDVADRRESHRRLFEDLLSLGCGRRADRAIAYGVGQASNEGEQARSGFEGFRDPRHLAGLRRARRLRPRLSFHVGHRSATNRGRRDDLERDRNRAREKDLELVARTDKGGSGAQGPLSELALSILDECPKIGAFVFSTGRSGVARAGGTASPVAISGWSKAKSALDRLALERVRANAIAQGGDPPEALDEWHVHDFRRTASTRMGSLGVDRVVISKVLNHAEAGVTAIYDRDERAAEKERALDRWAARLQEIVDGTGGGNVVRLATRAVQ